jgi:hypothetical protein
MARHLHDPGLLAFFSGSNNTPPSENTIRNNRRDLIHFSWTVAERRWKLARHEVSGGVIKKKSVLKGRWKCP